MLKRKCYNQSVIYICVIKPQLWKMTYVWLPLCLLNVRKDYYWTANIFCFENKYTFIDYLFPAVWHFFPLLVTRSSFMLLTWAFIIITCGYQYCLQKQKCMVPGILRLNFRQRDKKQTKKIKKLKRFNRIKH